MKRLIWLVAVFTTTPAVSQEIFWARAFPNKVIVVHGRDLTVGNVHLAKPSATIDGRPAQYLPDHTSDGPGALAEVQLFADTGGARITTTREDGQTASATIQRTKYDAVTTVTKVTAPFVIRSGSYANLTIEVSDGTTADSAVEIDQEGTRPILLKNVTIVNRVGKRGLTLTRCYDALFSGLRIVAEEPIYSPPNGKHGRNSFVECDLSAPHPEYGQAANRGMLGEENFVGWCHWHDIDRGLVGQQSGPPLTRNLLYRCWQSGTGTTIGGSEGVLFECPNGWPVTAAAAGAILRFTSDSPVDARVGLFACDLAARKWARITAVTKVQNNYTLTLDRDMGRSPAGQWFVGNAICENTIVHFRAESGKLGLHLFGRSMGNVCKFWDCRQIAAVVIEERMKNDRARNVYGWAWNNVYDHLRCTGESVGILRCELGFDATKPDEQLPWVHYAEKLSP